jgi:hypothetical protein
MSHSIRVRQHDLPRFAIDPVRRITRLSMLQSPGILCSSKIGSSSVTQKSPNWKAKKRTTKNTYTHINMSVKASPVSLWRTAASTAAMATTGILSRLFLYGTQRVKVDGMDKFLELLKARRNERNAGLLTGSLSKPQNGLTGKKWSLVLTASLQVSNHLSV